MSIALHPERRTHVGASECAALWSLGYESRYSLYARKAGLVPHDSENGAEQLQIGRLLEPAVAAVVMERTGWQLHKVRRYSPHPTVHGMGASLDYEIVAHADGPGVCEIKTVDGGAFAKWPRGADDERPAPPVWYELQLQHQLACTQRAWGVIAALVSNRTLQIYTRKRAPEAIAKLEAEVTVFWSEVLAGKAPAPDYAVDTKTLLEIFRSTTHDKTIDLSLNEEAQALAVAYKQQAEIASQMEEGKKRTKARLLELMGDAEIAQLPYGRITSRQVAEREMPAYTKRSYRTWSVTVEDIDEKEEP